MNANTIEAEGITVENLPEQHTCPWWVQYLLISPLRRLVESPAKLVGPYVEPDMTVLDPGCGFGYFSLPSAQMVGPEGRVVCVDLEPRAVERLKRRAARKGLAERIDARPCGPRDLGLDDYRGRIDLVTVMNTLHEFEDLPGFLEQAVALLKPAGRMLVVEPKGHVKPDQFATQLELCRGAGFRELEPPPYARKRPAALLEAPRT
jgi:cyclopropane fatty-acyl-phospholipid synthase-like methyltransferase